MENEIVTIEKDELKKAIDESVKAVVKELKLDDIRPSTPLRVTNDEPGIMENPGYALHSLLCAIKSGQKDRIKEVYEKSASPMTEGTPADGGYLVPDVTQATILELIPTYGQGRQYMSQIPMGKTNTLNIPKEANLPVVNWINENATISDSKPTIGQITLIAKKAAGIVVLSNELFQDANVAIGNYIIKKFAQKFGTAEDVQFFNGTGSPFNGVFKNTNTFGNTVTMTGQIGSLEYKDLIDCVYGIDAGLLTGAAWYMHRTVLAQVRNILDLQNRPIFVPASEGTPASLQREVKNTMLINLDDLKTYLKITGSTLDDFLTDAIEKAGAQLDVVTNRRLLYQTDEEIYIGNGLDRIFTKNFPVAYVNKVEVYNKNGDYTYQSLFDDPDTVSDSLLVQKHSERLLLKKGYVFPKNSFIKIDYTWGYDIGQEGEHTTPEDLQAAVVQIAADYYLKSFQGDSRLGKSAVNVGGAATSGTKYVPVDLTNIIARYRVRNV